MKITYLAHACFLMTAADGTRLITDPYDQSVGYRMPGESADVVSSSHSHFDHAFFQGVKGSFVKVTSPQEQLVNGIRVRGVRTAHDEAGGKKRGENIIFVFTIDDMQVVHCGDLGHTLTQSQIDQTGPVDVLMVPVGGYFTIDAGEAARVVDSLHPRLVIPMHYKTQSISFPIAPVDEFIKGYEEVRRDGSSEAEIRKESLPSRTEILVLEPSQLK